MATQPYGHSPPVLPPRADREYHPDKDTCGLCGKRRGTVKNLIGIPKAEFVCNECVDLLVEIIAEEDAENAK